MALAKHLLFLLFISHLLNIPDHMSGRATTDSWPTSRRSTEANVLTMDVP